MKKKIILTLLIMLSGVIVYAATTYLYASGDVSYDNTNTGLQLNNADVTNVQDAIDALYAKASASGGGGSSQTCSSSPFHLGDYVEFTPTSSSYPVDTTLRGNATAVTLDPSELSLWRVIRINPDCTVEVVSEYVSTNTVQFKGKVGYQNYVYMLNEIAKQYANTPTYTLDPATAPDGAFRNVGYDGQTLKITDTTRLNDQTLGTTTGAWYNKSSDMPGVEENLGGGDFKFATDLKLLSDAGVSTVAYKYNTTTKTDYWLGSRLFVWGSTSFWYFNARYVNSNGLINSTYLYRWNNSSFDMNNIAYSVRPVVTLKSGLTPPNGDGTSSNHFRWS